MSVTRSAPRVALIGCGAWGKNLARSLRALDALAAIVDPSPRGKDLARQVAPGTPVHDQADIVLGDETIDAVVIASPAETHYAMASRALDAGKDAFVEKPLTTDVREARTLVERAARQQRVLMVGHLLEYHPAILKLQELVAAGELGLIRYVISNRLNLGKIRTEENALWSFAPHDIAVILRLLGQTPLEVVATGGSYLTPNIADVTVTQLLFDRGIRAHVFVSWLHPFKEQKLVVVGSKKMASFDDVSKSLVLHDQRVDWEEGLPVPVRGEGVDVAFDDEEPLLSECRHFLDSVRHRSRPRTDGRSGLEVLRVLDAAQRSLMTNGCPVPLDPPSAPTDVRLPEIVTRPAPGAPTGTTASADHVAV